jgi:hypothetical protein
MDENYIDSKASQELRQWRRFLLPKSAFKKAYPLLRCHFQKSTYIDLHNSIVRGYTYSRKCARLLKLD